MNKKTLIIVVSCILAVAVLAASIFCLIKFVFKGGENTENKKPDITAENNDNDNSDTSNSTNSKPENNTNESDVFYDTPTIAIKDVIGKAGDTVKVPVKMYKNPGIMAYILNFKYDPAVLEYKGYKEGDFLTDYSFTAKNGVLTFVNVENDDVKEDGTMFYIEFKILDSKASRTEIKLNLTGEDAANINEQFVALAADNGTVTIK